MAAELGHPLGVTSPPGPGSARQGINEMLDAGLLDQLMDRVDPWVRSCPTRRSPPSPTRCSRRSVQYFGPGIVKSVLTLRTGNAWVHAWGNHAFAPHVTLDTVTLLDDLHLH